MYRCDLRCANLHNKFWFGVNSVLVPDRIPDTREFVGIFDILTEDDDRTAFRLYWEIPLIVGECCLPNEGNYAYFEGNYYHLTKTSYAGEFLDNGQYEPFYGYTITYDDWTSDGLRNRVYLKGAITLTGDKDLVRKNIYQTTPLISNVNDYRFLNGIKSEGRPDTIFKPANGDHFTSTNNLSTHDYWLLTDILKKINLGEPNPDKLVLPLVFKSYVSGDGRWNILKGIERLISDGIRLYDITDEKRSTLSQILHTNEVYSIASNKTVTFTYARTINNTKYISEIDLSGCEDLIELNTITLQPLYSELIDSPEAPPKFEVEKIVEYIYTKFKLKENLGDDDTLFSDLVDITAEEIARGIGGICAHTELDRFNKNVFRDVTIESIDRETIETDENVNSELRNVFDGAFPFLKFHKNYTFDDAFLEHRSLVSPKSGVEISDEELNTLKNKFATNDIEKFTKAFKEEAGKWFNIVQPLDNEYITLIVQTDKYKLTCESDCDGELDWSRKASENDNIIALIPDYKRKTHVLSQVSYIGTNIIGSPRDIQVLHPGRVPIVVFNELSEVKHVPLSEFHKPSDFMREYHETHKLLNTAQFEELKELGNIAIADLISKGVVFYQFIVGNYNIYYKYYYSKCSNNNYCEWANWNSSSNNGQYQAGKEPVYLSTSEYKEGGRNYHIQFTFPVRTGRHNIVALLEEYTDLGDEFLKWEVINDPRKRKKGTIKKYSQRVDEELKVSYHNKDSEKTVPGGLVVAIGLDLRRSGADGTSFERRPQELAKRLHELWFEEKGNEDTYGGIPNGIFNEGPTNRHPDGRPVLRFTWVKPYQGYYYTATFKFNPPIIRQWMKFGTSNGFDYGDSKDGFITIVPDRVYNFNSNIEDWLIYRPVPKYTYRERATQISREAIISFLFGGYFKKLDSGDPAQWENFRSRESFYIDIESFGSLQSGPIRKNFISDWKQDWKKAVWWHIAFTKLLNYKSSLLWVDYITNKGKHGLKTKRTSNPITLSKTYELDNRIKGDTLVTINNINSEVPPFIQKFFDPTKPAFCQTLVNGNPTGVKEVDNAVYSNFREEFRRKIRETTEIAKRLLSQQNHGFDLKGTKFLASVKLVNTDHPYGDFELFCKDRSLIKTHDTQKGNFINRPEKDVDVIINSNNSLNVHGKRIRLKSRFTDLSNELDIGFYIKPIEDPKQSKLATFYSMSMKGVLEQDVIPNTLIEVPKEVTQHVKISDFEREDLIRRVGMNEVQRLSEETLHNLNVDKFKMGDRHEKEKNKLDLKTQLAETYGIGASDIFYRGASGIYAGSAIAGSIYKMRSKTPNPITGLLGGLFGGVSSLASMFIKASEIGEHYNLNEQQRVDRLNHGLKELDTHGDLMMNKHQYQRGVDNLRLLNMSTNISYPQLTNNLVYKEFNKQNNLEDIYIIQHFPSGELKKFINKYYDEYGYEILVKDFECFGVESIKKHLRYSNIEINSHTNNQVRELIEQRAMNGIKIIPW